MDWDKLDKDLSENQGYVYFSDDGQRSPLVLAPEKYWNIKENGKFPSMSGIYDVFFDFGHLEATSKYAPHIINAVERANVLSDFLLRHVSLHLNNQSNIDIEDVLSLDKSNFPEQTPNEKTLSDWEAYIALIQCSILKMVQYQENQGLQESRISWLKNLFKLDERTDVDPRFEGKLMDHLKNCKDIVLTELEKRTFIKMSMSRFIEDPSQETPLFSFETNDFLMHKDIKGYEELTRFKNNILVPFLKTFTSENSRKEALKMLHEVLASNKFSDDIFSFYEDCYEALMIDKRFFGERVDYEKWDDKKKLLFLRYMASLQDESSLFDEERENSVKSGVLCARHFLQFLDNASAFTADQKTEYLNVLLGLRGDISFGFDDFFPAKPQKAIEFVHLFKDLRNDQTTTSLLSFKHFIYAFEEDFDSLTNDDDKKNLVTFLLKLDPNGHGYDEMKVLSKLFDRSLPSLEKQLSMLRQEGYWDNHKKFHPYDIALFMNAGINSFHMKEEETLSLIEILEWLNPEEIMAISKLQDRSYENVKKVADEMLTNKTQRNAGHYTNRHISFVPIQTEDGLTVPSFKVGFFH